MQTKLTLRLDTQLIGRAKSHARQTGKSVSQLVADYFALLNPQSAPVDVTLPPVTQALYGVLAPADVDEAAYHQHLDDKYQ